MRLLGHVKLVSHEGYLVVRSSFAPKPNDPVTDGRKRRVGRVVKVFGSTKTPYVTVKPEAGLKALAIIGQELYIPPEGEHGETKGRDGAYRKVPRVQQLPPGQRLRPR